MCLKNSFLINFVLYSILVVDHLLGITGRHIHYKDVSHAISRYIFVLSSLLYQLDTSDRSPEFCSK